eukprot:CAMPEP_0194396950 /NCGR_PEP_ID=MMETSP0174-20130528/125273_1 /TAXON_ID=216777 /ORGANISM="Proboscia alata, Strain PI-D3" /LENGTH=991 /DNA_ID=CAMNT_0039193073 /DNA_START=529 /DNA_END=3504 /DNA_ORIENTATION=+
MTRLAFVLLPLALLIYKASQNTTDCTNSDIHQQGDVHLKIMAQILGLMYIFTPTILKMQALYFLISICAQQSFSMVVMPVTIIHAFFAYWIVLRTDTCASTRNEKGYGEKMLFSLHAITFFFTLFYIQHLSSMPSTSLLLQWARLFAPTILYVGQYLLLLKGPNENWMERLGKYALRETLMEAVLKMKERLRETENRDLVKDVLIQWAWDTFCVSSDKTYCSEDERFDVRDEVGVRDKSVASSSTIELSNTSSTRIILETGRIAENKSSPSTKIKHQNCTPDLPSLATLRKDLTDATQSSASKSEVSRIATSDSMYHLQNILLTHCDPEKHLIPYHIRFKYFLQQSLPSSDTSTFITLLQKLPGLALSILLLLGSTCEVAEGFMKIFLLFPTIYTEIVLAIGERSRHRKVPTEIISTVTARQQRDKIFLSTESVLILFPSPNCIPRKLWSYLQNLNSAIENSINYSRVIHSLVLTKEVFCDGLSLASFGETVCSKGVLSHESLSMIFSEYVAATSTTDDSFQNTTSTSAIHAIFRNGQLLSRNLDIILVRGNGSSILRKIIERVGKEDGDKASSVTCLCDSVSMNKEEIVKDDEVSAYYEKASSVSSRIVNDFSRITHDESSLSPLYGENVHENSHDEKMALLHSKSKNVVLSPHGVMRKTGKEGISDDLVVKLGSSSCSFVATKDAVARNKYVENLVHVENDANNAKGEGKLTSCPETLIDNHLQIFNNFYTCRKPEVSHDSLQPNNKKNGPIISSPVMSLIGTDVIHPLNSEKDGENIDVCTYDADNAMDGFVVVDNSQHIKQNQQQELPLSDDRWTYIPEIKNSGALNTETVDECNNSTGSSASWDEIEKSPQLNYAERTKAVHGESNKSTSTVCALASTYFSRCHNLKKEPKQSQDHADVPQYQDSYSGCEQNCMSDNHVDHIGIKHGSSDDSSQNWTHWVGGSLAVAGAAIVGTVALSAKVHADEQRQLPAPISSVKVDEVLDDDE